VAVVATCCVVFLMIPLWFSVGSIAVIFWVMGVFIDKYLIGKYFTATDEKNGGAGTLVLFSAFFSIFVTIIAFFKTNFSVDISLNLIGLGLLAGLMNISWLILYLRTIEKTELSRAIPLFQTIPIFGFIFGYIILGEVLPVSTALAALTVVIGAFILSFHFSTEKNWFDGQTLLSMSCASALVALSEIVFKISALASDYWNTVFWFSLGVFLGGVIIYIFFSNYRNQFNKFIKNNNYMIFPLNGVNELIDNTANLVFVFALTLGPVALVMTVNSYQPFLILVLSSIMSYLMPKYFYEDLDSSTLLQKILVFPL
jgi:uncharacterized membrane protein